jgi:transposase
VDTKKKRRHDAEFKFKVALEALKGERSVTEICHIFAVAPAQVYAWKNLLEEKGALVFADKRKSENPTKDIEKLHAIIGHLVFEKEQHMKSKRTLTKSV